jgi:hypothetical protein
MWGNQWHDCTLDSGDGHSSASGEGHSSRGETFCSLYVAVMFPRLLNTLYYFHSFSLECTLQTNFPSAEFEVLTAVTMKNTVFCVLSPCNEVEVHRHFEGMYCLHFQGRGCGTEITTEKQSAGSLVTTLCALIGTVGKPFSSILKINARKNFVLCVLLRKVSEELMAWDMFNPATLSKLIWKGVGR